MMEKIHLQRVDYRELNGKQKEIYNFQKVAAKLADYGFNCIKLDDDWMGADFLAYHKDGTQTLRVQLKGRLTISKRYAGKDLYLCFPHQGDWYLVPHDTLVDIVGRLRTGSTRLLGKVDNTPAATPRRRHWRLWPITGWKERSLLGSRTTRPIADSVNLRYRTPPIHNTDFH